ncbi:MAG: peptidylprolyl isomerase [Pseudomonadota bacterium]
MARAIRLPAIAAILLMFAGACEPADPNVETAITVEGAVSSVVNGEPVYFADVELEAVNQGLIQPDAPFGLGHPAYQDVLDQLIDQRLMAQEAVAMQLDEDGTARRRLRAAEERVLGNLLVEDLVARNLSEALILETYGEQVRLQQIDDQVRLRHIVLATQDEALAARQRVLNREDFGALAFELSLDTETRINNGDLGFVAPATLDEPFVSNIANTSVGEMSAPFESDMGWHILQVVERRTPPPTTLDEMRPRIVSFLTLREISQILRSLRDEAVISPGNGVPAYTPSDSETEESP